MCRSEFEQLRWCHKTQMTTRAVVLLESSFWTEQNDCWRIFHTFRFAKKKNAKYGIGRQSIFTIFQASRRQEWCLSSTGYSNSHAYKVRKFVLRNDNAEYYRNQILYSKGKLSNGIGNIVRNQKTSWNCNGKNSWELCLHLVYRHEKAKSVLYVVFPLQLSLHSRHVS